MSNLESNGLISEIRKVLGAVLLLMALYGFKWLAETLLQLWEDPKSVAFVALIIEYSGSELIQAFKFGTTEVNIPSSWITIFGIFLSVSVLRLAWSMVKSLLMMAIFLMFPTSHKQMSEYTNRK